MISSVLDAKAQKVWFDTDALWVELFDGRKLSVPLAYFPRLSMATPEARNRFERAEWGWSRDTLGKS